MVNAHRVLNAHVAHNLDAKTVELSAKKSYKADGGLSK